MIRMAERNNLTGEACALRRTMITSINWDRVPRTKSMALIHLFQGKTKTHLEVDGFNFGKQLWSWLYPGLDLDNLTQNDFQRLIREVTGLVAGLCDQAEYCTARIVFDSPNCYNKTINDRVEVVFSGGTGQNRADTLILYDLESQKYSHDCDHIVVITDDHDLGYKAGNLGARLLGAVEFSNLLSRKVA